MKSVKTFCALNDSHDSSKITVEASFMRGFSGLQMIGNNSEVCKSGLVRAHTALENIGLKIPQRKIVFNLFPADLKKDGNQFDLAFAVCIFGLICNDLKKDLNSFLFAAEIGLDGALLPVKGCISIALTAITHNLEGMIVAKSNLDEVKTLCALSKVNTLEILGFTHIQEVLSWLKNTSPSTKKSFSFNQYAVKNLKTIQKEKSLDPNFDDMLLNPELEKLAIAIAAGKHNTMISGPPGCGKSMFCARLPSIMAPLKPSTHIETLKIHSGYSSKLKNDLIWGKPPFRNPHHQASASAVLGNADQPGEISLAHGGILFLDEFPEFRRDLLEALREPLETKYIEISRAKRKVSWKANITLIVAANNCPCGWLGSKGKVCICPSSKILAYKRKLSGPILDRIDIHINMSENMVHKKQLFANFEEKTKLSQTYRIAEKTTKTLAFSKKRNQALGISFNSELKSEHILSAFKLAKDDFLSLIHEFKLSQLSNRQALKFLRVARTMADLDFSETVKMKHMQDTYFWTQEFCAKARGDQAYNIL